MMLRWWFGKRQRVERSSGSADDAEREARSAIDDARCAVERLEATQRAAEAVHKMIRDRAAAGAFDELLLRANVPRRLRNGEVR